MDLWDRLTVLDGAIEGRPWHVSHGSNGVPLQGRSAFGQVFGCWGRDAAETARTYEFVTLCRNVIPETLEAVSRLIAAADLVLAGGGDAAEAELLGALGALRSAEVEEYVLKPLPEVKPRKAVPVVSGIPDTGPPETGGGA